MPKILRSVFNTQALPNAQRYDAWRDSISVVFGYELDKSVAAEDFFAEIDSALFSPFVLSSFRADAARYERDAARIARDGLDMVIIQYAMKGPCHIGGDLAQTDCQVGDIIIMDTAQPIQTWHAQQHNLTLSIPRQDLDNYSLDVERAHLSVLPAHTPMAVLMRSHMQALYQQAENLTRVEARALVAPTLAMAGAVINSTLGGSPDDSVSMKAATRARANQIIEKLLPTPDLTITQIAAQVPCSRSRLYALYKDEGGVAAYIQRRRLHVVAGKLQSARYRFHSISAIAYETGFINISSFNRAFKVRFGMTPKDMRPQSTPAHHRSAGLAGHSATDASRAYEDWVKNLLRSH